MRLQDVATIRTDFPEADFWVIRKGSAERCGEPTREFHKERIGIKVNQTNILLPDYLFYAMMHLHSKGAWIQIARGSTGLCNIRVSDVCQIELSPTR